MDVSPSYGWTPARPDSGIYIKKGIVDILSNIECTSILDAGCGNGDLASKLESIGYIVTGIDSDLTGITIARSICLKSTFHVGNFDNIIGKFDVVISTEVVEHLYDPDLFVKFCWNSVRPGGYLIVTTPYHGYFKNLVISLAGGWDRHFTARWTGGHIKFWSRATLAGLLEDAGFRVVGFKGLGRHWPVWKSMALIAARPKSE